jgi:hypothetical protein
MTKSSDTLFATSAPIIAPLPIGSAVAPPSLVAAAATTSTTPAWFAQIATSGIAADLKAADVSGALTKAGLTKLLSDVDSSLGASGLSAAQFKDLQTIAANMNVGVTSSAYLTYVFNALVDGNAANGQWTGGGAAGTALGNLKAGATAAQLSELEGKWLLGTDLPSDSVAMSGVKTFTVSYSNVSAPLFASTGQSMGDINQGYLGDCYFLSSCAELASQNAALVQSMFVNNGDGTYGVRFYYNGVAEYVTVNAALANGGAEFNHAADLWASLAEKAWAQFQALNLDTGNSVNPGNSWSTIGNGGDPAHALEALTGASAVTEFYGSGSGWADYVYNSSFGYRSSAVGLSTSNVLKTLASDLATHDDEVLSSLTNATDSTGKTTLVADHAMSIYGYDSATGMLEIRNPWGSATGQSWDTTFEISLSTLLADGDTISVDNIGNGALAPVVAAQTASQTLRYAASFSFALPSGTFTDPQGQKLTYAATLSTGGALPSWLSFNATTLTFSGVAPTSGASFTVALTATDAGGLSSSDQFNVLLTTPLAPKIAVQTANQTVTAAKSFSIALAANTFTDPQGEALTYSASLGNGSALPSWLSFNAKTETFSGVAPTPTSGANGVASSYTLDVKATDAGGAATIEAFTLAISTLAHALPASAASLSVASLPSAALLLAGH